MRLLKVAIVLPMLVLSACGGDDAVLQCEEGGSYMNATETPRVRAPEDLDNLDSLREIPLPEASPRAERSAGSGCLDRGRIAAGASDTGLQAR